MARVVGLDLGLARIGVAVSAGELAVGVGTLEKRITWIRDLSEMVAEYSPAEIVVGLPLSLSGRDSEMTRVVRDMAGEVESGLSLPVVLVDERLTSVAAKRALSSAGVAGRRMRGKVDELAAVAILQSYLDRRAIDT